MDNISNSDTKREVLKIGLNQNYQLSENRVKSKGSQPVEANKNTDTILVDFADAVINICWDREKH